MKRKIYLATSMAFMLLITACSSVAVGDAEKTQDPQQNDEVALPTEIIEPVEDIRMAEIVDIADDSVRMRVLWTINEYVIGTQFDGDEAEVKGMIFSPLDMTDTQISFSGKMCIDVVFNEESVDLSEYLNNTWQETPQSL